MVQDDLSGIYRIKIATFIAWLIFSIMVIRLFQMCIIEKETYVKLSEINRQKIIPVEPKRGIIYDRNGVPLVKNMPYFVAVLSPEYVPAEKLPEIGNFLNISTDELIEKIKNRRSELEPVVIKEGLTFEEVARIEARHSDYPGLSILATTIRTYLHGTTGAHLIGYLGRVTEEQWKSLSLEGVPPNAFVGQWGVEKIYDQALRGKYGKKIIEVDAMGHQIRLLGEVPPENGRDIVLSIDIELQRAMEEAYGSRAGAFVALNPLTGEILALGSLPSFDPNRFARGIDPEYWQRLSEDPGHPLLNRVFQSQYPPGSVFKIITAIAALEEGIIKPSTTFHCSGGIPFGNRYFRCWKKEGHGTMNLKQAIVESCDVYFYEVGRLVGIDRIAKYAKALGLGTPSGLEIVSEKKGIVPSSEWKLKAIGQPWYPGETLSASIGQGYVSTTPFQLARMIAAIANGGSLKTPTLLKIQGPPMGQNLVQQTTDSSNGRGSEEGLTISEKTLNFIRDSLKGVVNDDTGTGGAARLEHIEVAGKTGTAQVISKALDGHKLSEKQRDHAWFVAFAPVQNPEIAMAVFVEHGGHGGAVAAPIARVGLEKFFKKKGESISPEEYKGLHAAIPEIPHQEGR